MIKLFLTVLMAGSTAFAASYDVAKAGMDAERLAKIPVRMKAFVEKGAIAGAVMLIERHGVVASLDAVGYQDVESKKPMRTDSIFQIMSMTFVKNKNAHGPVTRRRMNRFGFAGRIGVVSRQVRRSVSP